MAAHKAITPGTVFSRLTVIDRCQNHGKKVSYLCVCSCGKERQIAGVSLKNGVTKSCGCLSKELVAKRAVVLMTTHGGSSKPEYKVWQAMLLRCHKTTCKDFKRYGARGISVCERWRNSFENFIDDMGYRLAKNYSLDRIDNNGNYEPGNCRWTTPTIQGNNKRSNRILVFNGEAKTVAEWSRHLKMPIKMLYDRVSQGWVASDALSTPKRTQ